MINSKTTDLFIRDGVKTFVDSEDNRVSVEDKLNNIVISRDFSHESKDVILNKRI